MMNKTEIFRKIGGIISELNEQYQYLSENFERMNELELELFVANSNFLTDHVEILKKMNKSAEEKSSNDVTFTEEPQVTSAGLTESLSAEPVNPTLPQLDTASAEKKSIFPEAAEDELEFDFEKKTLEELYDRALSEEEQEIINNKLAHSGIIKEVQEEMPIVETEMKEVETLTSEKNISPAETEPQVEPDTAPTVNDVISSQRNYNTIGAELNKQPISDLKAGISLNDKLLFIKNLFNGYSLAYSEAIEILNRFDAFESAETFLRMNYAEKNNWAANPSTVEKFYEVLIRRYLK